MSYKNIAKAGFLLLCSNTLSADTAKDLTYNNYLNISNESSKNAIMVGATTAIAKGYGAILTNPAGLSSNMNTTIYARSTLTSKKDQETLIAETRPENQFSIGFLYNNLAVEYKLSDHIVFGGAYGYESRYGLFSVGLSYLYDSTNNTISDKIKVDEVSSDEYATGNYGTIGIAWQKSFINEGRYYAVYLGASKKYSGKYSGTLKNENVIPISPEKLSFGIGLETNIYSTSILLSMDIAEESWLSISEKRSLTAYAAKWLIGEKFGISVGICNQENSGNLLGKMNTIGGGVEFGFFNIHTNISVLQRKINDIENQVYLTEQSAHLDVALTF